MLFTFSFMSLKNIFNNKLIGIIAFIVIIFLVWTRKVNAQTNDSIDISGTIYSIFRETVDSVEIIANYNNNEHKLYTDKKGNYNFIVKANNNFRVHRIKLQFSRFDYRQLDTIIFIKTDFRVRDIDFQMIPKYKILVKGRVFVANTPVENVDVLVKHNDNIQNLSTLGCYFDEENYWNCLYLGMFKTEISTDNIYDTIYIRFSKDGFKSQMHKFCFANYSGDILKFKLKYTDSIPGLPMNNLSLKILYPFSDNYGWYIAFAYHHRFNIKGFDRLALGAEASMATFKFHNIHSTFPGIDNSTFDSTYLSGFIGPSLLVYITKPYIRKFSSYAGSTFSIGLHNGEFVLQPFIGTRFFMDLRKSFSIEARYMAYHRNVVEYSFNYLGDADRSISTRLEQRFIINFGIQINF